MTIQRDGAERAAVALDKGGRILLTRLLYLGDVVLTLPVIDALQSRFPNCEIDYLTRPPADALLRADSRLSQVFTLPAGQSLRDATAMIAALRKRRYQLAIDFYSNPRSAWLTWLSGARVRIGGNRRGRRYLYTHPTTVPQQVRAASEFHMHYLRPLGIHQAPGKPNVEIAEDSKKWADEWLIEKRLAGRLVGLHPGGKWSVKRWPLERFQQLARLLAERGDRVVVFTGPGETRLSKELADAVEGSAALVPERSIADVAALISRLNAMVVSDGGVMHVSVAVNTPTVGIFGSAEPDKWFPYEHLGAFRAAFEPIDCRPCHQHECPLGHTRCLKDITPQRVLADVEAVAR